MLMSLHGLGEDLKTYDTNIIQHKVPLNPNVKPFR